MSNLRFVIRFAFFVFAFGVFEERNDMAVTVMKYRELSCCVVVDQDLAG